jgi:hypothetical protein
VIRPYEFTSEYPGCPESVRLARRMVARVLGGWPAADAAVLAVSELATNSVRWSRSGHADGTYLVQVAVTPVTSAVVFVADRGIGRTFETDGLDGGRGLQIVASIAQAWGIARPGCGAWTGATVGEQRTAAELAAPRGGTCTWFRVGWDVPGGALSQTQRGAGTGAWPEVMERAGWRCECAGACGRPHRCPAEHAAGHPLHLVPVWPASEPVAARLPAAALVALCADCHAGMARGALRTADTMRPSPAS